MSHLPYASPSPIHSQDLCNRSKEVRQLLSPARPPSSLWVTLSCDEWTLCLFATFLARFVHHLTIKVYLSGVRMLHVEQGFPDPVQNCLRLQRVVRRIKRSQGSSSSNRLPITDSHMLLIWKSLNSHLPDHCMFWALAHWGTLVSPALPSSQCPIWPASLPQFT